MLSHQISLVTTLALALPILHDCECARPDPDPDPDPDQPKIVFVTQALFPGDLGGLEGADVLCTEEAARAGLSGTYTAWLSDATGDAVTRITPSSTGYARVDGTVIADDLADLTDGELDAEISLDQFGDLVMELLWTRTTEAGLAEPGAPDCLGWTSGSAAELGRVGANATRFEGWSNSNTARPCDSASPLYCFED